MNGSFEDGIRDEVPGEDIWDEIPEALEVQLDQLTAEERNQLLSNNIDSDKAAQIVQRLDGSAGDYEANLRRIDQVLGLLAFGLGAALKVAKPV